MADENPAPGTAKDVGTPGGMLAITEPAARISILVILLVIRLLITGLGIPGMLYTETLAYRVCIGQYPYCCATMRWNLSLGVATPLSKSAGSKQSHAQDQAQSKRDAYFP